MHTPPQTFFRQLAPFALAHHRRHAIVHLVVSSSYKGKPVAPHKRSGLFSCPTLVAWPSLLVAACVHVVPLGAMSVFLWGDTLYGSPVSWPLLGVSLRCRFFYQPCTLHRASVPLVSL